MITNTSEGQVLWDTDKKHKWTKQSNHASPELKTLSDEDCDKIEATIADYLDLLPFANISDVPKDADWSPDADYGSKVTNKNLEVYKLTWTDKSHGGSPIFRMRRYFVDPGTGLPSKVEFHQKFTAADDYTLQMEMVVKSLRDDEMRAAVKKVFP
jgi:hypothetical protein